jgi:RNA polymerase sigma factor for flagellar operon FliA
MREAAAINLDNGYSIEHGADRERAVNACTQLVKHIAYRLALRLPTHVNVNDLISAGMVGLLEAIDRFNDKRGTKLETFAYRRIQGAMLDELRSMDWVAPSARQKSRQIQETYATLEGRLGRQPTEDEVANSLGITVEHYRSTWSTIQSLAVISIEDLGIINGEKEEDYLSYLQDPSEIGPEMRARFEEVKQILSLHIDFLPENEKIVLSLYYYDELTLKEIGKIMGLTESRICQLHAKAILGLKEKLKTELPARSEEWEETALEAEIAV